ncbi:MAG: cystathionine gamma-synthase [Schleiferiaceae bacterium]|nr:cystathionine gamma-synthase [Schleiferiaceae bacterium]
MANPKHLKTETLLIHGGQSPDPSTGAVMPPIYQTSTFAQEAPGAHKGYAYARAKNPTRTALENALASIEGGTYGLAFGSGMAAVDAVLKLLHPGDEVIATNDLYGGTYRLFTKIFADFGIVFHFVDMQDMAAISSCITPKTKMLWVETPTNPMLNIFDIAALGKLAKVHQLLLVVDNTFGTPYLQNPLALGAHIVLHSATKYLGGHSDLVLGGLVVNDAALAERLYFIQNASGAISGPMDSFLALRGIKTLHVRMDRHGENAEKIAHFLEKHPSVDRVYWPGFSHHPGHDIAKKQMRNFGGMVSFSLKNDTKAAAFRVISHLKVITLAESLGGVESLAGHPATMTHGSIPEATRKEVGIVDSLIRLSIGLENAADLIDDLEQALER